MPLVTMLGLVGNILSILVLRSPRIDMKVRRNEEIYMKVRGRRKMKEWQMTMVWCE